MEPCEPAYPTVETLRLLLSSPPVLPSEDEPVWSPAAGTAGGVHAAADAAPPPQSPNSAAAVDANGDGRFRAVPVERAEALTYDAFVARYMAPNAPVLIRGAARGWPAARDWAGPGGSGAAGVDVDVDAFAARAPRCRVRVTDAARRFAGRGPCEEMALEDYADWWRRCRPRPAAADGAPQHGEDDEQGARTAVPPPPPPAPPPARALAQAAGRPVGTDGRLLYLKDFHYAAERPDAVAYSLPVWFQEDWLDAFYRGSGRGGGCSGNGGGGGSGDGSGAAASAAPDSAAPASPAPAAAAAAPAPAAKAATADYRFVYLGPAGSWTPLHADVLRSFSWSANVAGWKRWRLAPPGATARLRRRGGGAGGAGGELAPDFDIGDLGRPPGCGSGGGHGHGHGSSGNSDSGGAGACEEEEEEEEEPEGGWLEEADFPGLAAARGELFEVVQGPGDALFVPSGW